MVIALGVGIRVEIAREEKLLPMPLTSLDPVNLKSLEIRCADCRTRRFEHQPTAGGCRNLIRCAPTTRAVSRLATVAKARVRTKLDINAYDLAKLGLDPPRITVKLDDVQIDFGDEDPIEHDRYARVGSELFRVPDRFSARLLESPETEIDRHVIDADAAIVEVSIDGQPPRADLAAAWKNAIAAQMQPTDTDAANAVSAIVELADATKLEFSVHRENEHYVVRRNDIHLDYLVSEVPGTSAARQGELTMPELPEVETTRRGIAPYLEGRRVLDVVIRQRNLRWPIPAAVRKKLPGQIIERVDRRAKYLLAHTQAGTAIMHLGMSGSLRVLKPDAPIGAHDHFDWRMDSGKILRFTDPRRFGSLLWQAPGETHPLLANLGPEPLSDEFDGDYLWRKSRGRSAAVKIFLMDQNIVVGVGNIYASEALFAAGIHPGARRVRFLALVTRDSPTKRNAFSRTPSGAVARRFAISSIPTACRVISNRNCSSTAAAANRARCAARRFV